MRQGSFGYVNVVDLASISSEINTLQRNSKTMNAELKNKKIVESELSSFLDQILIEPELIKSICLSEVNETYIEFVMSLHKKLDFVSKSNEAAGSHAFTSIIGELEKLKLKAIGKIREFLIYRIYSLKKPKTNVQIIQQTVLLKYRYLYHFLTKFGSQWAAEVKNAYIDTISKIFLFYFKQYIAGLSKLQYEGIIRPELIGTIQNISGISKKRTSLSSVHFTNIGDKLSPKERAELLFNAMSSPTIVPHVAIENQEKYAYEHIFRSMNLLLVDTVSSEYLFDLQFFGSSDENSTTILSQAQFDLITTVLYAIFEKIIAAFLDTLESYTSNSHDVLAILLMLSVNQQNVSTMKRRKIPFLFDYFEKVQGILMNRLIFLIQLNVDSVKKVIQSPIIGIADIRPHYITRRYAEFIASIASIQVDASEIEQTIANQLFLLSNYMEEFLKKMSMALEKKLRSVFLINNYDLIVTILEEREITPKVSQSFKTLRATEVKAFIEEELFQYFHGLIVFVQKTEPTNPLVDIGLDALNTAEKLVKDFCSSWKTFIEQINQDIMKYFSNFRNGSDILKQTLTQLALYYSRFEDIVKKNFKTASFRRDLVPISAVRFEIQKHLTQTF